MRRVLLRDCTTSPINRFAALLIGQVLILHLIAADDMLMRQNKSSVELIDLSSNTCFHKVFARNIVLTESAKMDTANIDN